MKEIKKNLKKKEKTEWYTYSFVAADPFPPLPSRPARPPTPSLSTHHPVSQIFCPASNFRRVTSLACYIAYAK